MVDKEMTDVARNAAASTRQAAETANDCAVRGIDVAREYAGTTRDYANKSYDAARDYANQGYDTAREYANAGMDVAARMSENLTEFVRNDPWIAMAAAFAVGYVAARLMRRLSILA